jgi:hypothetical protein
MCREFRKERGEVGAEGSVLPLEERGGRGEVEGAAQAETHAVKDLCDAGDFTIRAKPVVRPHLLELGIGIGRNVGAIMLKRIVNLGGECVQWDVREGLPFAGKKMVVEDIDENAAESAVRRNEPLNAAAEDGMRIGIRIDLPVPSNSHLKLQRQLGQGGLRSEVRQNVAEAKGGSRLGEMEMSEPVQFKWDWRIAGTLVSITASLP